jgi:hypothetical protein
MPKQISVPVAKFRVRLTLGLAGLVCVGVCVCAAHILAAAFAPNAQAQERRNAFGEQSAGEAAFTGIFYDLKKTQDGTVSDVNVQNYWGVLDEFIAKGWDETVLNRYYRASRALSTTQIFIPYMAADRAPAAFGVQKTVSQSRWVIHYKAQVSPPTTGRYRFWGASDDIIAVAVDSKNVLVKPFHADTAQRFPRSNWLRTEATNPSGVQAASDVLRAGDWMNLRADQIYDLDVLIGELPGGQFFAFLLCEKEGEKYATEGERKAPILPIFQVAPYNTPTINSGAPRFVPNGPIWKSHQ